MSVANIPFKFTNGETLDPKKINRNFQKIAKDVTDTKAQRFTYSSFVLNFDGITSADTAESRTFRINAPVAYDIVGVELQYYDGAASTITLTCTATGFQTVNLTTTASATTRAYSYKQQNSNVPVNTNCDFVLAVSAGTIETCKVIIHIRASRYVTVTGYEPSAVRAFASGETLDPAILNTEFSTIEAAVTDDTNQQNDLRIQVITRRNLVSPFPGTDNLVKIPSSSRIINKMDVVNVAAATNNFAASLLDETAASVGSGTANGGGTTTIARTSVTINDTQSVNLPATPASDYTLSLSRSGAGVATILVAYVVIYYT
jgi:hypothetical protein